MFHGKTCARCRATKPISEFTKNRSRVDGLCHYCKTCKAQAAAQRYADNPEKLRAASREWYAANRQRAVERAQKHREADPERHLASSRKSKRRARAVNPDRFRESYREWRAANPEKAREYDRRRRAAIKLGVSVYQFTTADIAAKIAFWGALCWMCSAPYEAIDHVKPLAKGGPHMLANLRPICTSCNTRKRDRWPLP